MPAPSENTTELDPQRLAELLGSQWPRAIVTRHTASTNRDLAQAAKDGAPAWTIHTTHHQVAGRGRLDRTFEMPEGTGIALSVLVRPSSDAPLPWTWLPHLVGLAVAQSFETLGVPTVLKWPNDVLTREQKKLAGILVERVETPTGPAAVIGVGINVSLSPDQLPVPTATSLRIEGATSTNRVDILVAIATTLREWVDRWEDGDLAAIKAAYGELCLTVGQRVRILIEGADDINGLAEGIDDFGCLIVDGTAYSAGDVQHVRPENLA